MIDAEFAAYRALSPTDQMVARLKGLAEVVNASGMVLIGEETEAMDRDMPENAAPPDRLKAFGEEAAEFADADQGWHLSPSEVARLEGTLGLVPGTLSLAIKELPDRR